MRRGTTRARGRVLGILMAAAAGTTVIALPSSASAHTELAGTVPAAGTVSRSPVAGVSLEFAGPVLPDLTAVVVTRGGTGAVPLGEPVVDGSTVKATIDGAAEAGRYTVAYRTVAADGHPITGSFSFEVAAPRTSAAPARTRRDEGGGVTTDRRGTGRAAVVDTAAEQGSSLRSSSPALASTAGSADGEPVGLAVLGLLGVGAVAVAAGAGLLRRRSLA